MDYFYDKQIRRFLIQFIRAFSEFKVDYGKDTSGNRILHRVPVRYVANSKQAISLINNNSDTVQNTIPLMVCYITGLKYLRTDVRSPDFVDKRIVRERNYNETTDTYERTQKQAFTLERYMPVPYELSIKLDIITANTEQKLQLIEQIAVWFNPSLELQSNDNFYDWTSLSAIELVDTVWGSKDFTSPDDAFDVASMSFTMPIWITAPAKLKKMGAVRNIVVSTFDSGGEDDPSYDFEQYLRMGPRQYFTPTGHNLIALGNQLTLVKKGGIISGQGEFDTPGATGNPINWQGILSSIGSITDGVTQVYLDNEVNNKTVVGTIASHPTDPFTMLFNIDPDTVPVNTIPSITAIIDPRKSGPGTGLPAPASNQSYMILSSIGNTNNTSANQPVAWKNSDGSTTNADANDIIKWDGAKWIVIFDSSASTSVQYVTNLFSGIQYKWADGEWTKSWEGFYAEGTWSIEI